MSKSLVHPIKQLQSQQRREMRKYAPVSNFLKILANENSEDQPDLTNAEMLARKAWRKALSDDKDSLHWTVLLLDRIEGKVNQVVTVDNPNAIVEQLYTKLAINGMSEEQIRTTLIGMGVDEGFLPPPKEEPVIIETEVISSEVVV